MSWKQVSLADVAEQIQYGYTASATDEAIGPQFLRITDIVPDYINWDTVPYCPITEKDAAKYKIEKGDIVIARTGNTTGYAKLIRQDVNAVFASYLIRIKLDTRLADPGFVGRLVESPSYKAFVDGVKGGAAQGNANAKTLSLFSFKLPPLPVQQKIASILAAYDDLIDNNRKRIALLEKAARLLYEEWFVRLQFPGHEHTPVVDGVPEGWKTASVKNICYEVKDAVHPNQIEGGTAYIGLEHIPRKSITLQDWGQPEDVSSLKYRYLKGDILFGKIRPYFHKVGFTLNSGICSTDAIVLRPTQEKYYALLLMYVSSEAFVNEATQSSNGTKMPRANWKHLEKLVVLIAPDVLLKTFSDYVKPILLQLENAAVQNQKLQQARDLLLPRLMSGELAV